MILAKARLIVRTDGNLKIGLSFPTGFDPEEVLGDTVRANGVHAAEAVSADPRRGRIEDIYRECHVWFPAAALPADSAAARVSLNITGKLRRGLTFSASLPIVIREGTDH
jgi:hypothetical protein